VEKARRRREETEAEGCCWNLEADDFFYVKTLLLVSSPIYSSKVKSKKINKK